MVCSYPFIISTDTAFTVSRVTGSDTTHLAACGTELVEVKSSLLDIVDMCYIHIEFMIVYPILSVLGSWFVANG